MKVGNARLFQNRPGKGSLFVQRDDRDLVPGLEESLPQRLHQYAHATAETKRIFQTQRDFHSPVYGSPNMFVEA